MDRSLRLDPNQLSGLPVVHPPPMLREAAEGSAAETLRRVETLEAPAAAGATGRPRRDQVDGLGCDAWNEFKETYAEWLMLVFASSLLHFLRGRCICKGG